MFLPSRPIFSKTVHRILIKFIEDFIYRIKLMRIFFQADILKNLGSVENVCIEGGLSASVRFQNSLVLLQLICLTLQPHFSIKLVIFHLDSAKPEAALRRRGKNISHSSPTHEGCFFRSPRDKLLRILKPECALLHRNYNYFS